MAPTTTSYISIPASTSAMEAAVMAVDKADPPFSSTVMEMSIWKEKEEEQNYAASH